MMDVNFQKLVYYPAYNVLSFRSVFIGAVKVMSIEKKIDATLRNIEGKAQEVIGEVTGDPKQKAEGQAKQAEAAVEHTIENLKDAAKRKIDGK